MSRTNRRAAIWAAWMLVLTAAPDATACPQATGAAHDTVEIAKTSALGKSRLPSTAVEVDAVQDRAVGVFVRTPTVPPSAAAASSGAAPKSDLLLGTTVQGELPLGEVACGAGCRSLVTPEQKQYEFVVGDCRLHSMNFTLRSNGTGRFTGRAYSNDTGDELSAVYAVLLNQRGDVLRRLPPLPVPGGWTTYWWNGEGIPVSPGWKHIERGFDFAPEMYVHVKRVLLSVHC
jgi:hypothetical protein